MNESNKIMLMSIATVFLKKGYTPEGIIDGLSKQGISKSYAEEILELANGENRESLKESGRFQVGVPGKDFSKLLCSDNNCPCPGTEKLEPGKTGFLFISEDVVNSRKEIRTCIDLINQSMPEVPNMTTPVLVCKTGAKKRNIDLNIAAADAKIWYEDGTAPLRASILIEKPLNQPRENKKPNFFERIFGTNKSLNENLRDTQLNITSDYNPLFFPTLEDEQVFYMGNVMPLNEWFNLYRDESIFIFALPEKDYGEPRYPRDWNIYRTNSERKQMEDEFISLYIKYAKILVSYSSDRKVNFTQHNHYQTANASAVWLIMAPKHKMLRREFDVLLDDIQPRLRTALERIFR